MMKEIIKDMRKAQSKYVLNNKYELTKDLLKYISQRIDANKEEIEKLIELKKEKHTYEEIKKVINEELEEDILYKNYGKMYINAQNFISTNMLMPIGVVAVEVYDTVEVIKYIIKGIKSRNAVVISDVEYDEYSVKFLILEIIKEALRKFEIDENIIDIMSYEECLYEYFDKVIYTYNIEGEKLEENKYEEKDVTDEKYVYIEDESLEKAAREDNEEQEYKVLKGDFEEIIKTLNEKYNKAVVIYTKDPQLAYRFVNLVNSENIFVNASLINVKEKEKSPDELYEYKNIILPIPQKILEEEKETIEDVKEITENIDETKKENLDLVKVDDGVLAKIKRFLRKILG